jgi:hypothetical protein
VHHGAGTDVPTIYTENPRDHCAQDGTTSPARANSIEVFDTKRGKNRFWAGYVEFDDEGWLHRSAEKMSQIEAIDQKLKGELNDKQYEGTDFLVVAFIHGWHHNANDTDCNVSEFRAMLQLADDFYAAAAAGDPKVKPRRIIGIYGAWRGESVPVEGLKYTTVLDRRNAAERVAKGDVRELFAVLRKLQVGEEKKMVGDVRMRADRMRTVVVGHSFGGLIAFHGLSPAVLSELTLTKPEPDTDGQPCKATVVRPLSVVKGPGDTQGEAPQPVSEFQPPVFPDILVLINPAFEATRFETIHDLMHPVPGCEYPPDRPKVVVVTADNDRWTGPVFNAGRHVLTAFEAYPPEADGRTNERDSNTHAIGFTERYKTHRLCLVPGPNGSLHAAAYLAPPNPDWPNPDPNAPVWVVDVPKEIVDGHDGFLFAAKTGTKQEPYLLDWLVSLHVYGPKDNARVMTTPDKCSPDGLAQKPPSASATSEVRVPLTPNSLASR